MFVSVISESEPLRLIYRLFCTYNLCPDAKAGPVIGPLGCCLTTVDVKAFHHFTKQTELFSVIPVWHSDTYWAVSTLSAATCSPITVCVFLCSPLAGKKRMVLATMARLLAAEVVSLDHTSWRGKTLQSPLSPPFVLFLFCHWKDILSTGHEAPDSRVTPHLQRWLTAPQIENCCWSCSEVLPPKANFVWLILFSNAILLDLSVFDSLYTVF